MSAITISELPRHEGREVHLRGWLYNSRSSGKVQFLLVRDGTGVVQAVASLKVLGEAQFAEAGALTQESSLEVWGTVKADPRAPGGYELQLSRLHTVQRAEEYPISPKEHGIEFLLDHRHLWLRSSRQHAILAIRAEVIRAAREYLDDHGFVNCDTPILTPAACEGTTTLFRVEYYEEFSYLAQSGQLYNEATAAAFGKVYCFGPTFRAEKSKTRRHLTEFWMLEPEMAYADLDEVMRVEEELLTHVVGRVLERRRGELERLERDPARLEKVKPPFPRVAYTDAVRRLQEKGLPFEWGGDFGAPDEAALSEDHETPFFVHRYPTQVKPFYMEPDPLDGRVCLSVDCLAPEGYGEIVGGGQRIADLELLRARIREQGLPEQAFDWYLDLRKYGSVPHGGFGIGLERTVAWICGVEHVRECIPFPRTIYRTRP
ncbi:MAG TPA: asparagine--tRNA ligase [Candidatus Saccharimonadales bacterium]|nr:asparagine--tRNA ligase [Candidatus Saccharimonadales bacterium]